MNLISRRRVLFQLTLACALSLFPFTITPAHAADLAGSERIKGSQGAALQALLEGRVDEARALLQTTLAQNSSDATAHQLLCRVFYSQEQADPAIRECELAVTGTPASDAARASYAQLWLGRAYGMKARHAGPLTGQRVPHLGYGQGDQRRHRALYAPAAKLIDLQRCSKS